MRTPDEIKKGLECRTAHGRNRRAKCKECPFRWKSPGCEFRMHRQTLAYIQHKERENAEQAETIERLNNGTHELLVKIQQLEAERETAVNDLRYAVSHPHTAGVCYACKHHDDCEFQDDCDTVENNHWEWRGVQKEDGNDS